MTDNLSRQEAIERAKRISNVNYKIELDVTSAVLSGPEGEIFTSTTTITFDYHPDDTSAVKHGTFVDLKAREVQHIVLNGKNVDTSVFGEHRVKLPASLLQESNVLTITANCEYTNTGEGLHKYVAEDGGAPSGAATSEGTGAAAGAPAEVYLYTQFEVADSRRMFAVFEQPDIKARFDLTVRAPQGWQLTSTELEVEKSAAGSHALWKFRTTPVMSSYLLSLCAGPFQVWETSHRNADGRDIPMRILVRQALAHATDADYIFDITKRGFDFYAKLFGVPFPYNKYDQVFMPQFNAGAMENIGNVTYREDYIFDVAVPEAFRERRVITILHELAHMWFGDLVTMKWWDDLWLNESFAEYVSTLATSEITEYSNAWVAFNVAEKAGGLVQDELSTTHPVVADIKDLSDVLVNFDGITYAKGAAALQALVNHVGSDTFFRGINNYLNKYAYSNATLADLLAELSAVVGGGENELKAWSKVWLQTAGANTLSPEISATAGVIDAFNISQTAPSEHPTLRPHTIQVGLYNFTDESLQSITNNSAFAEKDGTIPATATGALNLRGAKLVRHKTVTVNVLPQGSTPVPELVGQTRPDLLLINDGGWTFAKVRFDDKSSQVALRYAHKVTDPLARALIVDTLWNLVRDGLLPAEHYIDMVFRVIASETESIIIDKVLKNLLVAAFHYVPLSEREQILKGVGSNLWALLREAEVGSDAQYQFLLFFTKFATTGDHVSVLQNLLRGTHQLRGLELDSKLQWQIRTALARLGALDKPSILVARSADLSEHGKLGAAEALASLPSVSAKRAAFDAVYDDLSELSNSEISATACGFSGVTDFSLLKPFVNEYFERIGEIWDKKEFAIAEIIIRYFYPARLASLELAQLGERWLDENQKRPPALLRLVRENLDSTKRALNAQRCR